MEFPSLPDSASDLLIKDGKQLMRTLGVYETLRRFSHILQLTPFRFEDFTACLLAEEQSPLLAEVHIQLLKTLMREDRLQQTWLCPPDLRDSVNVYLHLADHACWPASLKVYLSADPYSNHDVLEQLDGTKNGQQSYPFNTGLESRLMVLEQLCDQFLLSNLVREIVNGASTITKQDTVCRLCQKATGHLIACNNCPAIYHLKCSDPPLEDYPNVLNGDEAYLCAICRSNRITGVTDCISNEEMSGNLKRHEAIGIDSLHRRYWFLIRRLFVVDETEDDVRYYSKIEQLENIIDFLIHNSSSDDEGLIENLQNLKAEIERQMKITADLHESLLKGYKNEDGTYTRLLGQDNGFKSYTNHASSNLAISKNQNSDREVNRGLSNKFCMTSANSFKWSGAINGLFQTLNVTVRSSILKFEAAIPHTFLHPRWSGQKRSTWIRSVNYAHEPKDYAKALTELEAAIRPILFKQAWTDSVGFTQLFRSTFLEREELKKTDRQPRGFERREWVSQDFELSQRMGTMVKFSSKLKPVKHQVWKQKGEEYRLTGLNGWFWKSSTYRLGRISKKSKKQKLAQPMIPPCHDFLTRRNKVQSILVLPDDELKRLARSGGQREAKSFSYTAKQNNYVWPYGMTPRPTFRTCWLYKNQLVSTIQEVALQLKVFFACIRWDDLQARPHPSGHNVIMTDDATITIELTKKRDRLPYLNHSEYLIKKTTTPVSEPAEKKRKISLGRVGSTPSSRSGLRARRKTEDNEPKGPTTEMLWVPEEQLELWEIKMFDEKIERQNQIMKERAMREEAERRRKAEEEKRKKAEAERRRKAEEEATKARIGAAQAASTPSVPAATPDARPATPVLRYFRTEQGQIIRLPASVLQRGTPLILRHVGPGSGQTSTYIIRPHVAPTTLTTIRPTPVLTSQPAAIVKPNPVKVEQEAPPPPSPPPPPPVTPTKTAEPAEPKEPENAKPPMEGPAVSSSQ